MKSFRGRTIKQGQRVFVYRNLHKNTWSIRDVSTGLVLGYSDTLTLNNVTFTVSEKGRQRVLKEKVKNVHAGVVGDYVSSDIISLKGCLEITYNPYLYDSFVNKATGDKVFNAPTVKMKIPKVWISNTIWQTMNFMVYY